MFKTIFASLLLAAVAGCASTPEAAPTRLDATTVESAERTFLRMADELPGDGWQKLSMAMIAINMKNVNSAHQVVGNPELQSPSIGRIKDEVAGMTAQEIIEYAAKVSTVRIEVQRR